MPAIGPVYQPTTYNVGYEQQSEWQQTPRRNWYNKFLDCIQSESCCKHSITVCAIVAIIFAQFITIQLLYIVTFGHASLFHGDEITTEKILYLLLAVVVVLLDAALFVFIYLRFIKNKRIMYMWPSLMRKDGTLGRQMGGQTRNAQTLVLNPSTDLLVTAAQYGPTVEAPPAMHEEDERIVLMVNENKESNEDMEERSALQSDPRIVLRPA